jgi:hypothetical protein
MKKIFYIIIFTMLSMNIFALFSGLIDQYLYTDNGQALSVVTKMADWAYNKLNLLDEETRSCMIHNEFGGINESFYNLYSITGNERYLWLSHFFYHNEVIDPLKEQRNDLGTKHTNTFIPKVIAEARKHESSGDEASRQAVDFFMQTMLDDHTFAPGCVSDKEHFFDPKEFSGHISGHTGETCCTYNHDFHFSAKGKINRKNDSGIYPKGKTGLENASGSCRKGKNRLKTVFMLTPNSAYHNNDELFVNLFIPSELILREENENTANAIEFY